MSEGDTQAETTGNELSEAYGEFFSDNEEGRTTEQAEPTGEEEGETEESSSDPADTDKAGAATDWEARARELEARNRELEEFRGRQGNELGQLRKEMAELKGTVEKQQPKTDPLEKYPQVKALDPKQQDLFLQGGYAAIERYLQDHGLTIEDLRNARDLSAQTSQQMTEEFLNREIGALKQEFGEETFGKYLPQLKAVAERHPTLSPREAWNMVTAEDSRKSQVDRAAALSKERKERAKSADFGNERPAKTLSNRLSREDVQKLSPVGSGKPSPRFKALYQEAKRELGG